MYGRMHKSTFPNIEKNCILNGAVAAEGGLDRMTASACKEATSVFSESNLQADAKAAKGDIVLNW